MAPSTLESMIGRAEEPEPTRRSIPTPVMIVVGMVVLMWVIEIIDTWVLSERLQRQGIAPREIDQLDGILWAPFLHADWRHITANTAPFLLLSALVAVRGFRNWVLVTAAGILIGGGLTWVFGGSGNHIGASGVVFAYLGSLLGAAFFERSARTAAPALVAILLYSTMLIGLVPQQGISWEGHLAGFVSGIGVSKLTARPRRARLEEPPDDDAYWLE